MWKRWLVLMFRNIVRRKTGKTQPFYSNFDYRNVSLINYFYKDMKPDKG